MVSYSRKDLVLSNYNHRSMPLVHVLSVRDLEVKFKLEFKFNNHIINICSVPHKSLGFIKLEAFDDLSNIIYNFIIKQ